MIIYIASLGLVRHLDAGWSPSQLASPVPSVLELACIPFCATTRCADFSSSVMLSDAGPSLEVMFVLEGRKGLMAGVPCAGMIG